MLKLSSHNSFPTKYICVDRSYNVLFIENSVILAQCLLRTVWRLLRRVTYKGFYHEFTDTSEKADNGCGGVSCNDEENTQKSLNRKLFT